MDKRCKYNWTDVQSFYDKGSSLDETMKHFRIKSKQTFYKAVERGKFKTRSLSDGIKMGHKRTGKRVPTAAVKKKISEGRIKYLLANPDKVPYRINHSSNKSWPEKVFENALISSGIRGWTPRFRNGIYEYDFAFISEKIDVEVDGGTHKLEKVKRIDARRDAFSKSQGWKVVRFDASRVKKDVVGCINELKQILQS